MGVSHQLARAPQSAEATCARQGVPVRVTDRTAIGRSWCSWVRAARRGRCGRGRSGSDHGRPIRQPPGQARRKRSPADFERQVGPLFPDAAPSPTCPAMAMVCVSRLALRMPVSARASIGFRARVLQECDLPVPVLPSPASSSSARVRRASARVEPASASACWALRLERSRAGSSVSSQTQERLSRQASSTGSDMTASASTPSQPQFLWRRRSSSPISSQRAAARNA